MNIHIDRGGQQYGPYPLEQIKGWLSSGEMSAATMASTDGGISWAPVYCIPDIRNDQSLERIIRTATSANMEVESKIIDDTLKEIEGLMSTTDTTTLANIQGRLQWKLRILYKQVYSFKAEFPNALEAQAYEGAFYSAQARAQILSVGGWRKSQMRSGNLAWGLVSGLMANQQEKNNIMKALPLFDRALSIFDNPTDRLTKAYLYKELNQPQDALRELNHICAHFVDDEAYIAARQFKDEIETP